MQSYAHQPCLPHKMVVAAALNALKKGTTLTTMAEVRNNDVPLACSWRDAIADCDCM